ncbi:hypothetical protein QQF64_032369 [Cirrhinus molitorella]|uniref:Gypsy retrotransposon integrase-like protein 1 n=1 Tax=Cirrhinus molitorella TaxID=172907 RepID=A0ABR3MZK1_9TELE
MHRTKNAVSCKNAHMERVIGDGGNGIWTVDTRWRHFRNNWQPWRGDWPKRKKKRIDWLLKINDCQGVLQWRLGLCGKSEAPQREGVATDPEKIRAVAEWASPQTTKELRSFLGFASYYRRFVPGFANITASLHQLAAVGEEPKAYADFTKPFVLDKDASHAGLGAVLSQEEGGKLRPVAYASRGLREAEPKLGSVEQRWAAQLAMFDFEIVYRPGKKNGNADALSRQDFIGGEQQVGLKEMVSTTTAHAISVFPEFQGRGPDKGERREESKDTLELLRQWDKVEDSEGILYRVVADARGGWVKQLLLPEVLKQEVLGQLHDYQGHEGIDRTFKLVRQRFYWPGMYQEVQDFCKNCIQCMVSKDVQPKVKTVMNSIQASKPLEVVALDFTMLERSKSGKENVLVITDVFSKFTVAVPTADQRAVTVAKVLVKEWIHRLWGASSDSF